MSKNVEKGDHKDPHKDEKVDHKDGRVDKGHKGGESQN